MALGSCMAVAPLASLDPLLAGLADWLNRTQVKETAWGVGVSLDMLMLLLHPVCFWAYKSQLGSQWWLDVVPFTVANGNNTAVQLHTSCTTVVG